MKSLIHFLPFALVALGVHATADVKLPAIFGDHMVLQRDASVPVWGWAAPDEGVTVSFGSVKASTNADKDGKWMVRLAGLKASDTPGELDISGASNQIAVHDVLIGDVWICAGSLNMSFPLSQSITGDVELRKADHPEMRLFVETFRSALTPQTDCQGSWVLCTPDTAKSFSAVGYYFGQEIAASEKTPVGLIGIYPQPYGQDFSAEAWTALDPLLADDDLKKTCTGLIQDNSGLGWLQGAHDKWLQQGGQVYLDILAKWKTEADQAYAKGQPVPDRPKPPLDLPSEPLPPDTMWLPSALFNGVISPVIPFAIKGVAWDQGEADVGQTGLYNKLVSSMVTDWRQQWGEGDFPFVYVQLPNSNSPKRDADGNSEWSLLREAQLLTLKTLLHSGMAVTLDIGDPTTAFPTDKADVGHRLALVARRIAYGEDGIFFRSHLRY